MLITTGKQRLQGVGIGEQTMEIEKIISIIDKLMLAVIENKQIEATIDIEPDRVQVNIEPWEPYETKCPYGKEER